MVSLSRFSDSHYHPPRCLRRHSGGRRHSLLFQRCERRSTQARHLISEFLCLHPARIPAARSTCTQGWCEPLNSSIAHARQPAGSLASCFVPMPDYPCALQAWAPAHSLPASPFSVHIHTHTTGYRPLGSGSFTSTSMGNVGRSVFEISVGNIDADFEYYVDASCDGGSALFPAGAPTVTQSIVVM